MSTLLACVPGTVAPAQTGARGRGFGPGGERPWIPAFAGMTVDEGTVDKGMTIDERTVDKGMTIDERTVGKGMTVDEGAVDKGMTIDEGTVDKGTTIDRGMTTDARMTAGTGARA